MEIADIKRKKIIKGLSPVPYLIFGVICFIISVYLLSLLTINRAQLKQFIWNDEILEVVTEKNKILEEFRQKAGTPLEQELYNFSLNQHKKEIAFVGQGWKALIKLAALSLGVMAVFLFSFAWSSFCNQNNLVRLFEIENH